MDAGIGTRNRFVVSGHAVLAIPPTFVKRVAGFFDAATVSSNWMRRIRDAVLNRNRVVRRFTLIRKANCVIDVARFPANVAPFLNLDVERNRCATVDCHVANDRPNCTFVATAKDEQGTRHKQANTQSEVSHRRALSPEFN